MIKIKESLEEIEEKMKKQTEANKLQRIQMLYIIKTGKAKTRKEVAEILGLNRETIGDWLRKYEKNGLEELLNIKAKGGSKPLLSSEIIEAMREKLEQPENAFLSYKQLKKWVEEKFSITTTYWQIYYAATEILPSRLAVPRKSHAKKREFRANI